MNDHMKMVGIIGFGSFGKFLAEKLSSHAKVLVYSPSGTASSWSASLAEVAAADFLIPAIPLQSYVPMLTDLKPHLHKKTVVVDVCSVKAKPLSLLREYLPDQPMVATHPMFGPESASVSFSGHTIVLCPEASTAEAYEYIKDFAASLELKVIEMSCQQHDAEIAVVQGLTFFIARSLNNMGIHNQQLHTPSFQRLLNLAELEQHHSQQLFETIQIGNGYTEKVRENFLKAAQDINNNLKQMGH